MAIILILLKFMALSQTTRLDYFRTSASDNEVILSWNTFAEDGADLFTVYASQDGKSWEKLGEVKSCEVETGCIYALNAGARVGVWYYKLAWKNGFSYGTSTTPIKPAMVQYNILGQQTNQGWLIH